MPTEEEWELVKVRVEQMPSHMKISIGNKNYNKDDIINHVEKRDEVGKLISEIELNYLKALKDIEMIK